MEDIDVMPLAAFSVVEMDPPLLMSKRRCRPLDNETYSSIYSTNKTVTFPFNISFYQSLDSLITISH